MEKKIPERRCVGCGESFPKRDLLRVVRTPEGNVTLDATGKANGRGAYVCRRSECFRTARKKRRSKENRRKQRRSEHAGIEKGKKVH